jgi:hypothetical protein
MDYMEMSAAYLSGIGNKIVSIKSSYALNDTLEFDTDEQKEQFNKYALANVKEATKLMLAYGRGIIVVFERGDDLSMPIRSGLDIKTAKMRVFGGNIVTASNASLDLMNDRYMKPTSYNVRGYPIHHSRVIDFTYIKPPEDLLGLYRYGGVSEFEMIRAQLVNDAVVERACATIVEKNSVVYNKIKGFKDAIEAGHDSHIIDYIGRMADLRSIYADGIIDSEDDVISIAQTLTNLADCNNITLSRLALVTGIPVSELVGEQPKGLNSTGESDRESLSYTIEGLQSEYLITPINELAKRFGMGEVAFKDIQGGSVTARVTAEGKVIDNATKLAEIGEDYRAYLVKYDLAEESPYAAFFPENDADESMPQQ